ncbi:nucleolar protein of 40 kDa isoform X1 [Rhinatrema bivittatum]|uniref:nucleolar protein of 40 kDa isoform X1 n=1 Tax=Rhinatrema bivittatum TaxID=194408 RepID=UPI00112A6E90|nr:nucleolar protein of 40 kDa isoform X1 [Rhinatrema bivittatum]XP_029427601.1 nucleolar protein of 40 kDa isoform X1 [Rhinatrema bivittatum]XP_029427602.1 nucleolar protein of 40 kDa isoform X1 [Rhinatrema bivittatum]
MDPVMSYGRSDSVEGLPALYDIFKGEVASITEYGAFIKIPGCRKQGLVHRTHMSSCRVENPSEIVDIGEKVWVKVTGIESGPAQETPVPGLQQAEDYPGGRPEHRLQEMRLQRSLCQGMFYAARRNKIQFGSRGRGGNTARRSGKEKKKGEEEEEEEIQRERHILRSRGGGELRLRKQGKPLCSHTQEALLKTQEKEAQEIQTQGVKYRGEQRTSTCQQGGSGSVFCTATCLCNSFLQLGLALFLQLRV